MYNLYTDGSCINNPGVGGWAYVIEYKGKLIYEGSGRVGMTTTNNRMEMYAILMGLSVIPDGKELTIISDSQYALGAIKKIELWERENKLKNKANQDLLSKIKAEKNRLTLNTKWVKGHSGNLYNDLVDSLAREQAYKEHTIP